MGSGVLAMVLCVLPLASQDSSILYSSPWEKLWSTRHYGKMTGSKECIRGSSQWPLQHTIHDNNLNPMMSRECVMLHGRLRDRTTPTHWTHPDNHFRVQISSKSAIRMQASRSSYHHQTRCCGGESAQWARQQLCVDMQPISVTRDKWKSCGEDCQLQWRHSGIVRAPSETAARLSSGPSHRPNLATVPPADSGFRPSASTFPVILCFPRLVLCLFHGVDATSLQFHRTISRKADTLRRRAGLWNTFSIFQRNPHSCRSGFREL